MGAMQTRRGEAGSTSPRRVEERGGRGEGDRVSTGEASQSMGARLSLGGTASNREQASSGEREHVSQ